MQPTSPTWKWMLADGGKGLPAAEYTGAAVSFDNPGHTYPKALSVAIALAQGGSGDPSPDNVRPITGWDGVKVTRCGKNLLNNGATSRTVSGIAFTVDSDGTVRAVGTATATAQLNFELPDISGDVKFTGCPAGGGNSTYDCYLWDSTANARFKKWDGTTESKSDYGNTLQEAQIPYGHVGRFVLHIRQGVSVDIVFSPMIVARDESDAAYAPYTGETYDITFPAGAGAVYGGTLDVTTGLLTVTHKRVKISDLNWAYVSGSMSRFRVDPSDMVRATEHRVNEIISSIYAPNVGGGPWEDFTVYNVGSPTGGNSMYVVDSRFTTRTDWLAAVGDETIVYPLATPATYRLDPVAVALLQGTNNLRADAGDVTVSLGALGDVGLEAVAEIGGTEYTDLPAAPVVNRALMQGGLSVGNAVSASCALSVRTVNSLPRAAEVVLKARLTDGETASEWLPAGTFYISRRSVDPVTGVVALECYDALLKANALWEPAEGDLPMAMADAAEALAGLLGVALDERNDIATGADCVIDSLAEGETIRDTLARIAVANGGNWIITPANRLRLVPLLDAADADAATADALDVEGVTGGISVQPASVVTGIRYGGGDGDAILGDDTGTVIDIGENAAFLQVLYDRLVGLTFRPFDLAGAVYDPAAELGDYVRAGANGEVASVLHSEVASYGPGFTGSLSAPQGGELADEYPYIGGAANKALLAARAYARQVTEALDGALTQQEVFDRLTAHGAAQGLFLTQDGQLFVNASYLNAGEINAAVVKILNLSVEDLSSKLIHSADYRTVDIPLIYPSDDLYPSDHLYPNYGERVVRGFAIDLTTGQVYGGFFSAQITALQETVTELQDTINGMKNSLVYPKERPALTAPMALAPMGAAELNEANEAETEEDE